MKYFFKVPVFFSCTPSDCLGQVGDTSCHVTLESVAALAWVPWERDHADPRQRASGSCCKGCGLQSPTPGSLDGSLTHPDAVHDGCGFALGRLGVANEVIPSTEHPPAERVVFTGSAGEARAGVLSHPAREDQRKPWFKGDTCPQCSLQHHSQQPAHGSNLNIHQQRNGWICGVYKQGSITQP